MNKENRYLPFFILSLIIIAICLASWRIYLPGLYYDEMIFGNAAVGGKTDNFIRSRILGIPVLIMSYVGALKAWIYYPLFSIFPVNCWTVRLPSILIGVAGGLALVIALWRGFGRSTALAGSVMILLDPTMLMHSRLDWGPNAFMFFFRGLLLLSLVNWIRTKDPKWAWLALAAIGLGIFDKLNFLWIAGAAICSLILIYHRACRDFARNHPRHTIALAGLTAIGLSIAIFRGIRLAEHIETNWTDRISYACYLLRLSLSGGGALDFIAGNGFRTEKWFWPGYLAAAIFIVSSWRFISRKTPEKQLYNWIITFILFLTAAFILTKSATGTHHSSVLSGIWQMSLAPLLGAAWDNKDLRHRQIRQILFPLTLILIFAGNIIVSLICIDAFAKPTNSNWDPANAEAAIFAKRHPEADFICADWGIAPQVIALTHDRPGARDAWPDFQNKDSACLLINNLQKGRDTYIYTRLPGFENFKNNRANLVLTLNASHISYRVVETYANWKGQPMIEIWKISFEPAGPQVR
jgi:4-amino-4-deoxy-L-arabinose transferase-like glycosyltransferase